MLCHFFLSRFFSIAAAIYQSRSDSKEEIDNRQKRIDGSVLKTALLISWPLSSWVRLDILKFASTAPKVPNTLDPISNRQVFQSHINH